MKINSTHTAFSSAFFSLIFISLLISCQEPRKVVDEEVNPDKNFSGQVNDTVEIKKLGVKHRDTLELFAPLPQAISLKKFCPGIAGQSYGTCYSYASAYAARTILYNVTVGDSVTPDNNAFSPGFVQRLVFGTSLRKCRNNGTDTHYACRLMSENGCLKLKDYPDDCSNMFISKELYAEALKYKIKSIGLYEACSDNEYKILQIKTTLSQKKPVIICFNNSDSFHSPSGNTEIWEPTPADKNEIDCQSSNHAICVIGYDDTKFGGAFEIMNSYGNKWKGDGFVWVKYNDFADYAAYAIEISNP